MKKNEKIYVAGHKGLVGSAIVRSLKRNGFSNLAIKSHSELDLTNQSDVDSFFMNEKPDYVFLAAAKVGGILANNNYPADFIYANIAIQTNIIHASWQHNVKRLLFLGSSCIYPRDCSQPIREEYLLTGPLEETNEPYAIAKITGIKMCQSYNKQYGTQFCSVMPTNLYGPYDNFDLENSHVLPALLRKFHEAKKNNNSSSDKLEVWGTGNPYREFLHSEDLAAACYYIMNLEDNVFIDNLIKADVPLVNIGSGIDIRIKDLALMIKDVVGFKGDIYFNTEKPDGTPRKLLNLERINNLGWKSSIPLKKGIEETYRWCLKNNIFSI